MRRLILMSLFVAAATPAFAHWDGPRAGHREVAQERRIDWGVRSGRLTQHEAYRLRQAEARIDRMEHWARSDGVVTPHERSRIRHARDVQAMRIDRELRDHQHDYNHDGRRDHRRYY